MRQRVWGCGVSADGEERKRKGAERGGDTDDLFFGGVGVCE